MKGDLVIQREVASFTVLSRNRENTLKLQITLIIGLLDKAIKEGRSITLEDIRQIHAEYCYSIRRINLGRNYYTDAEGTKWRLPRTIQEYYDGYTGERTSIPWFRSNLGDAILKGKILAVPVIDVT